MAFSRQGSEPWPPHRAKASTRLGNGDVSISGQTEGAGVADTPAEGEGAGDKNIG
jgi:hypothetical protein